MGLLAEGMGSVSDFATCSWDPFLLRIPSLGSSSCGALGLVQCVIHDWLKDMEGLHFSEDKEEGEGWGKCLEGEDVGKL